MSELQHPDSFLPEESARQSSPGVLSILPYILIPLLVWALFRVASPNRTQTRDGEPLPNCRNNLRQISLALFNYHDREGCFPPAYVADELGRPMHSWRVLILPWLDQQPLYNEYRIDEPWDGPNNRKLADRIVSVYSCPKSGVSKGSPDASDASYVAVVGPGTAWPGTSSTRLSDFKDGAVYTVLLVEVANSGIHWMEPRDLHVSQMSPTVNGKTGQGISGPHNGGAYVQIADGSIRWLPDSLPPDVIRALLSIDGGDQVPDEF